METEKAEPRPPEGVRLVLEGGGEVPCEMVRDPALDRPAGHPQGAVTYWRAVPAREVDKATCQVRCDVLPARTAFWVDMELAGPGDFGTPAVRE